METKTFTFNETPITFEFSSDDNLMVNATEMAKVFNKDLFQFTKRDDTISFIDVCLKPANAGLLGIVNKSDLIVSRQKAGTYMHRVLALKFASWLDPEFELWVYSTIDQILFGEFHELKEKLKTAADRKARIEYLKNQIKNDPNIDKRVSELMELESKDKKENSSRYATLNKQMVEMKNQFIIRFEEENKVSE